MQKNRDTFLDVAKAIGIILVIIGHSSLPRFNEIIGAFHIPLFFMISGILCAKSDLYISDHTIFEALQKKIKSLLFPYYLWGVADLLIYSIVSPELFDGKKGLVLQLIYFVFGQRKTDEYYFTGTLWFLTALFSCEMIFFVIYRLCKKNVGLTGIVLLIVCFIIFLINVSSGNTLLFNLDTCPMLIPFFYVGFVTSRYNLYDKWKEKKVNPMLQFVVIIFFLLLLVWISYSNSQINIYKMRYGNIVLYYLGAFSGCAFVFSLLKLLDRMVYASFLIKVVSFIGINSMDYMAIHQQWIIHPLNCSDIVIYNSKANFLFRFVLCFLGSSAIIYLKKKLLILLRTKKTDLR